MLIYPARIDKSIQNRFLSRRVPLRAGSGFGFEGGGGFVVYHFNITIHDKLLAGGRCLEFSQSHAHRQPHRSRDNPQSESEKTLYCGTIWRAYFILFACVIFSFLQERF